MALCLKIKGRELSMVYKTPYNLSPTTTHYLISSLLYVSLAFQSPSPHWLFLTDSRDTYSSGSLHSLFPLLIMLLLKLSAYLIPSSLCSFVRYHLHNENFSCHSIPISLNPLLTLINTSIFSILLCFIFLLFLYHYPVHGG